MGFIDVIKAKAKENLKTIVLPETEDVRTYEAAANVLKEGTAKIVLVGSKEEIEKNGAGFDISGATIVDPATFEKTEEYIAKLVELRSKKGMTEEKARELLLTNYLYYGVMMVKMGDADGMVSGACHSTADTLRPCLQILKTKPGTKLVSAFFVMVVPDCEYGANGTFIFADSGLEQNPDSEKLANIAISSAESFKALVGEEPKVAMLSHSTMGSAKHADVDKVVEATRIAKELAPDLALDGEMQLDAAIVPEIGKSKAPNSKVAGQANVLVFPDLDAGNIGYKLVQRLAKAEAYGPLTQGIAKPVNDLSRGCSAADIEGVVAITARVFSPEMDGKVAKASLSTYEGKDQEDKVKWSFWWARFVGPKAKKASRMEDGTQIILKKAKIENVYDKKEKKAYYTVTVFDWDYYQDEDEDE